MNSPPSTARVFGIGLSKTGTTSLNQALAILGYRTVHYPPLDRLTDLLEWHDAATDTPVACSFADLDRRYPGSRFILTVRPPLSWLDSARQEFEGRSVQEPWKREVRLRTYGALEWEPATFLRAYLNHLDVVRDYFADRRDVLLVLDLVGGAGWAPLCQFLDRPIPPVAFPHRNARPARSGSAL